MKMTGDSIAKKRPIRGHASFHPYQKPDGRWYWFDEIKAESLPYETREAAEAAIARYRDCFVRPRKTRHRNNLEELVTKLKSFQWPEASKYRTAMPDERGGWAEWCL